MAFCQEFAPSDEELAAYKKGEEWDPEKAKHEAKLRVTIIKIYRKLCRGGGACDDELTAYKKGQEWDLERAQLEAKLRVNILVYAGGGKTILFTPPPHSFMYDTCMYDYFAEMGTKNLVCDGLRDC